MNNVSKMLDRLRTLATQSASDTFTGDRNVVNTEFKSLTTEIDRQAQSIGLDTNGKFAKSLRVYLGGGNAASTGELDTNNGTVSVDLTSSTVDTHSLGLKGMQVVAGRPTSAPDPPPTQWRRSWRIRPTTTAVGGFSDMFFAGAGFSDANKVKVSVNTTGVTDITTLASAINSAIQTPATAPRRRRRRSRTQAS